MKNPVRLTEVLSQLPKGTDDINWNNRLELKVPSVSESHVTNVLMTKSDFDTWLREYVLRHVEVPMLTIEKVSDTKWKAEVINTGFVEGRKKADNEFAKMIKNFNN